MEPAGDIILFDGVCTLCSRSVQFVIRRDPAERFRFCSLQSEAGQALLRANGLAPGEFDSVVLMDAAGGVHQCSDAVWRICARLRFPWSCLAVLRVIPRPLRDAGYRLVARNRYRWFGRRDSCLVPTEPLKRRFLDGDPGG